MTRLGEISSGLFRAEAIDQFVQLQVTSLDLLDQVLSFFLFSACLFRCLYFLVGCVAL